MDGVPWDCLRVLFYFFEGCMDGWNMHIELAWLHIHTYTNTKYADWIGI